MVVSFEAYLSHFYRVGQHFLKSTDWEGLLQDEGADGQVWGHILQTWKQHRGSGKAEWNRITGSTAHTRGELKLAPYLSIGCGFKEAETVPEAFTGQAQLNLLLQDGGSTLQNDLVILYPKQPTASVTGLWSTFNLVYVSICTTGYNYREKWSILLDLLFFLQRNCEKDKVGRCA